MKILDTPHLCLEVELVDPTVRVLSRILSQKKALRACFLNTLTVFLVKDDKLHTQYAKVWGNHSKDRVCRSAAQTVHFSCMCVYMCVFVCVSWIVWWEEGFLSFHSCCHSQQLSRKRGTPISPFLSIMHVVQLYLSRKKIWMPEWSHILSPGFMAFRVHLFRRLKSLSPWQSDFPPDFGFGSSCHTLEFATLLCTLRKEALM